MRPLGMLVITALFIVVGAIGWACAHEAPLGWTYPLACCSGIDCRDVPKAAVLESPSGYVIVTSGETVPYRDPRVRPSPDGRYHWCSVGGSDEGRTLCLFVPDKGY